MKELLKQAVAPVQDTELHCDLWLQMLYKLDEQPLPVHEGRDGSGKENENRAQDGGEHPVSPVKLEAL
jgi:hypothetical protein